MLLVTVFVIFFMFLAYSRLPLVSAELLAAGDMFTNLQRGGEGAILLVTYTHAGSFLSFLNSQT